MSITISQAGRGAEGIAAEVFGYACQVASGEVEDEGTLPILFENPLDADPFDEATWHRANPGLARGYPDLTMLRQFVREAASRPAMLAKLKNDHLGIWLESNDTPWLDLATWDAGTPGLVDLDERTGETCWLGVDLGRTDDLNQVVVALGEASIIDNAADALLAEGGFSTPCELDGAADPNAAGQYVIPAANARALAGKASIGHTSVFDQNYAGLASDVQVGFRTLMAPRVYSLPDVDAYPLGQDHVVADESGACSDVLTITIQPGPGTGDVIGGPEGATTIVLSSPYQAVRFRRDAANLWIRV